MFISTYVQFQSMKKIQIVYCGNSKPHVLDNGETAFDDRLTATFNDNKFNLKISNAKYKDSGKYSVDVLLRSIELEFSAVTLIVHSIFFEFLLVINLLGKFSKNLFHS